MRPIANAQMSLHSRKDFFGSIRLVHQIVHSHRRVCALGRRNGAYLDSLATLSLPNASRCLRAVHARHAEVHPDEVWPPGGEDPDCLWTTAGNLHPEPGLQKKTPQEMLILSIV